MRDEEPGVQQPGAFEQPQGGGAVQLPHQVPFVQALEAVEPYEDVAAARDRGGLPHERLGERLDAARQQHAVDQRVGQCGRVIEEAFGVPEPVAAEVLVELDAPAAVGQGHVDAGAVGGPR
ncbi:hypothetical protein ACFVH0_02165 [Streptomyces sp. NPDC127117]|uniref:hypothetical protein n=1 Tax=Streptomyces sp. NPDC127117 TaxID=3345368 RepID=UPI003629AF1B